MKKDMWVFIAYKGPYHTPFFSKLFTDHTELKEFSGEHSAEWKPEVEGYSSTYIKIDEV